jgi:hypothetical protein
MNKPTAPIARTAIRGAGWKKPTTISTAKYEAVVNAILSVLPGQPIRFTELVGRVERQLPDFEGSVAWYTITCARELEVQGRLVRHARPVLYSRPAETRQAVAAVRSRKVKKDGARPA